MINKQKVLDGLRACASYDYMCETCPYFVDAGCHVNTLLQDALSLLTAHVYTLDELYNILDACNPDSVEPTFYIELHQPNYLDLKLGYIESADFVYAPKDFMVYYPHQLQPSILYCDLYGKTWRVWSNYPTAEERANAKWRT